MTTPSAGDQLLGDFLRLRDAMPASDLQRLVAAIQADPALGRRLKDALLVDEAATRLLLPERTSFLAGVQQRLHPAQGTRSLARRVLRRARRQRQTTGRRSRILPILALAAVLVAGLLLWPRAQPVAEPAPAAVVVAGTPQRTGGDLLRAGSRLASGDELTCRGPVTIALADRSTLEFSAESRLRIDSLTSTARFSLTSGTVAAQVNHRPAATALSIATVEALVTVVGTGFSVSRDDRGTRVAVRDGTVLVDDHLQAPMRLTAGGTRVIAAAVALPTPLVRWSGDHPTDPGHDLHGRCPTTEVGAVTVAGGALIFSGGRLNAPPLVLSTTQGVTVTAWLNAAKPLADWQCVVGGLDAGPGLKFGLAGADTTRPGLAIFDSHRISGRAMSGRTRLDDNAWHHVAWVWRPDGSRLLVVNGKVEDQDTCPGLATIPWQHWRPTVGAGDTDGRNTFRGRLDEVHIYERALCAEECAAVMRQER